MAMNDENTCVWKEAFMANFNVLSNYFLRCMKKIMKYIRQDSQVSGSRFKPGTLQIMKKDR
jgi:hypothetical protein